MKYEPTVPPRVFEVGRGETIQIKDCGRVHLEADEQVTFVTERGAEYDVARKSWGFYATPSMNGRLAGFGLRSVLVRSYAAKLHVFLVERGREAEFRRYLEVEGHRVVAWLDTDEACRTVERKLADGFSEV